MRPAYKKLKYFLHSNGSGKNLVKLSLAIKDASFANTKQIWKTDPRTAKTRSFK